MTRRARFSYHSPLCAGWAVEFLRPLVGVSPSGARVPMISSRDGQPIGEATVDHEFFYREATEPTWLSDSMCTALDRGHRKFLVVGPNDSVSPMLYEVAGTMHGVGIESYPTGLRDQPSVAVLQGTLDRLREVGCIAGGTEGYVADT